MLDFGIHTEHEFEAMHEDRFKSNLAAFYSGVTSNHIHEDLDCGVSIAETERRKTSKLDELSLLIDSIGDDLEKVSNTVPEKAPCFSFDEEVEYEKIYAEPQLTPYDKARLDVAACKAQLDELELGTEEYHAAMRELGNAKRTLKTEVYRGSDDGWRKRRAIDVHRSGNGREEYNASRRKRHTPNKQLTKMTAEQKENHRKAQKAENAWINRMKRNGWSDEQITAGMAKRQAKRLTKSSSN